MTTSVVSTSTALTTQESQYLSMLEATIKNGLGVFWKAGEALTAQSMPKAKTVGAIVKAHLARPVPKPSASNGALQRYEDQIAGALQNIKAQKLWRRVAESFDDYLDELVERIRGEE